jgi:hypothetical protein
MKKQSFGDAISKIANAGTIKQKETKKYIHTDLSKVFGPKLNKKMKELSDMIKDKMKKLGKS